MTGRAPARRWWFSRTGMCVAGAYLAFGIAALFTDVNQALLIAAAPGLLTFQALGIARISWMSDSQEVAAYIVTGAIELYLLCLIIGPAATWLRRWRE